MKTLRYSVVVAVVVALSACSPEPVLRTTPATTPVGQPTGAVVSKVIGAAGGTLSSADGKLSLVIPAGAVSTDIIFTATPISATAPGVLLAWRLGPEGTTFSTPVEVRFTATDADLAGSEPDALLIAYQAEGQWRAFKNATLDGKTISVKTTHLSDWSPLLGWQLRPGSANVKLGGAQTFAVRYCNQVPFQGDPELLSLTAECQEDDLTPILANWSVNGTLNGDATHGTVVEGVYTAPGARPTPNVVSVSVEFNPPPRKGRKTLLLANVTVGDEDKYVGSFQFVTAGSGYQLTGSATGVEFKLRRDSKDSREYTVSGNLTLSYTPSGCAKVDGTYPIEDGALTIYPAGAVVFPSSYQFTVQATPSAMTTCGANNTPTPLTIPAVMQAGFCTGSETVPFTDVKSLTGSGPCAAQSITSSMWSLSQQ
jgi:hypothetical protein